MIRLGKYINIFRSRFIQSVVLKAGCVWILLTGVWNDDGVWCDDENWNDT